MIFKRLEYNSCSYWQVRDSTSDQPCRCSPFVYANGARCLQDGRTVLWTGASCNSPLQSHSLPCAASDIKVAHLLQHLQYVSQALHCSGSSR